MRIRSIVGGFVGSLMVLAIATPAAAQSKVDFAAGYQSLTFLDGGDTIPAGWGASVGVGKEMIKFVADVGGHYESHTSHFAKLHTFQGGVEFSGKDRRVVPYGRVLMGLALFSDLGNDTAWVITPEAGVKIMANSRIGVQTSVGFPIFFDGSDHAEGFRFFAGIVIRKRK